MPFFRIHRLGRLAEIAAFTRFHFDEHQRAALLGDDVDLPRRRAVIAFQNGKTVLFQVSDGFVFPRSSVKFFIKVLLCIAHGPFSFIASICRFVP